MTGALNMGSQKIQALAAGTLGTDAVNVTQLNQAFSGYDPTATLDNRYLAASTKLNQVAAPTASVSMNT